MVLCLSVSGAQVITNAYSHCTCHVYHVRPVSVAQLDVPPTGDQEVAGSTYFLRSFSPFC